VSITLEYKRLTKKVDGEYPYTGEFKLDSGSVPFIGWSFKRVIGQLSDLLRAHPGASKVIVQRTDRPGIMPMGFGPLMLELLRKDPLAAYRALDVNAQQFTSSTTRALKVQAFAPTVYLQMRRGQVQCPITGTWRSLAFGDAHGWKIRGEGNAHDKWVRLLSIVDDAPEGTEGVQRVAFSTWAIVDVAMLLNMGAPRYFLPRAWNPNRDGWIDRKDLEALLKAYKEK